MEKLDFNYEDVTLQITDYLVKYWVLWRNGSTKYYLPYEYKWNAPYVSYSGFFRDRFYKCFAIELPDNYTQGLSIMFSNKVFLQGFKKRSDAFMVVFHLPNQILRTDITRRRAWPIRKNQNDYSMRFIVHNVEMFKRRRNCNQNWVDYDNEVIQYHMQKVGCRPPYHISNHTLPICQSNKQMKDIALRLSLGISHDFVPPCKGMEVVNYKYREAELSGSKWGSTGHVWSTLYIQDSRYKVSLLL